MDAILYYRCHTWFYTFAVHFSENWLFGINYFEILSDEISYTDVLYVYM